jgi:hypothetical protein
MKIRIPTPLILLALSTTEPGTGIVMTAYLVLFSPYSSPSSALTITISPHHQLTPDPPIEATNKE